MGILRQQHREPQLHGHSARRVDAVLGFHPDDHQFIHLCRRQLLRQLGAEKTAGPGFIENRVVA